MRSLLLLGLFGCSLLACSGAVTDDGAAAATGAGGAGGRATTGSHTTSTQVGSSSLNVTGSIDCASSVVGTGGQQGTGGAVAVGVGGAGAGGHSGTGGAVAGVGGGGVGGGDCGGFVQMTVDNGAPETLGSICFGANGSGETHEPDGYLFAGGPVGAPHGIQVDGCVAATQGSEGITLGILNAGGPGTYTMGDATYVDNMGATWNVPDTFNVVLTTVGPVGGVIEGSFNVSVSRGGNAAHLLDGKFRVCHVTDQFAP